MKIEIEKLARAFKRAYQVNCSDDGFYAARMMLYKAVDIFCLFDPEGINDITKEDMDLDIEELISKMTSWGEKTTSTTFGGMPVSKDDVKKLIEFHNK